MFVMFFICGLKVSNKIIHVLSIVFEVALTMQESAHNLTVHERKASHLGPIAMELFFIHGRSEQILHRVWEICCTIVCESDAVF